MYLGSESLEINMKCLKEIAREVCSAVRPLIGTEESKKVVGKGFGGDYTLLVDKIAEDTIINYLKHRKISCVFIGEECGILNLGEKPKSYLIADAIDGTTNATKGINFFSTSLAVSPTDNLGDIQIALVMNLLTKEIFEAKKGEGAKFRGKKIKTSETTCLKDAILGINISRSSDSVEPTSPFMKIAKSVRSFGSASLEICYVASGCLDAYIDIRSMLRPFDFAAALLIVWEAGGVVFQPDGRGYDGYSLSEINRFSILASANERLGCEIMSII